MFYLLENNRIIDSNVSYTKALPFWEEKEGRMIINKYQEALNNVKRVYVESEHYDEEDIRLLQKLVDKATPKKLKRQRLHYNCYNGASDKTFFYYCSKCNTDVYIGMKYCCECGQALDWSNEDD